MALNIQHLTRIFVLEKDGQNIVLPDPGSQYPPEKVLNFYSNTYPELTTGTIEGPVIVKDKAEFKMKSKVGTHG